MKKIELFLMAVRVPLDYIMLFFAGISAYALRFTGWARGLRAVQFDLSLGDFSEMLFPVAGVWVCIFAIGGLYSPDPNRKFTQEVTRIILACSTGLSAIAVYLLFTTQQFDSRFLVAVGWTFSIGYVILGRLGIRGIRALLYHAGIGRRRVVVVGEGRVADVVLDTIKRHPVLGYEVVGVFPSWTSETEKTLNGIVPDEVLFTNPKAKEEEALLALDACRERHVTFKYSADLFATYATNMAVSPLAGIPIVEIRRTKLDGWGRVMKRALDLCGSVAALLLFSPLMAISATLVFLETGRPVLYKNKRVGRFGKEFFLLKFRSMRQEYCTGEQFPRSKEAELFEQKLIASKNTKEGPVYKIGDDPRVTRVGKFLRQWSIDELPQFFNALRGEMSIVGPRPHQSREVANYERGQRQVLHIKPGITGLSQVSGRSDLSFEEEIRLDVLYMERWTLILDLIIMLKTPFILLKKRRAL